MQIGGLPIRRFDCSFLNDGLLPANLVNLTAGIASLKAMAGVRKDEPIHFRQREILHLHEMLLSVAGYEFGGRYKMGMMLGKYVSFGEQINHHEAFYYEALGQSSDGWHTNESSLGKTGQTKAF